MYGSCVNCSGKVAEVSHILANCGKCKTKMKISKCGHQSVVNIILNDAKAKEQSDCAPRDLGRRSLVMTATHINTLVTITTHINTLVTTATHVHINNCYQIAISTRVELYN